MSGHPNAVLQAHYATASAGKLLGHRRLAGPVLAMGCTPEFDDRMLRGLSACFSYGTRTQAYRAVDNYVYPGVRNFVRKRHKVQPHGTNRFSDEVVFGEPGVLRLRRVQPGASLVSLR
jgi:hypothetical protein